MAKTKKIVHKYYFSYKGYNFIDFDGHSAMTEGDWKQLNILYIYNYNEKTSKYYD
jgi:hypothetical protein